MLMVLKGIVEVSVMLGVFGRYDNCDSCADGKAKRGGFQVIDESEGFLQYRNRAVDS
jgi:hypothetical protein